jgi:hypothetical protein
MGCCFNNQQESHIEEPEPVREQTTQPTATVVVKLERVPTKKAPATLFEQILEEHNYHRAMHQAPPLKLHTELSEESQAYAENIASRGVTVRSDCKWQGKNIGENIACLEGTNVTGKQVVDTWYEDIKFYDFSNPKYTPAALQFTEMIWKKTEYIGIGCATAAGKTYIVANYSPAGSIPRAGQFAENVLPKKN